ncbi:septin-1-like [Onychostoma macrolepis]|uniref:septin-1-like n=1 Tax=Onychostoma macrolepis TaxID=369639 RepID=UPI00272C38BE|nr:septin-1-like [Onychostoma macrolepis]
MVGETGTGKTSLINAMINYILGVRWEHKIWLEVAEVSENQTESQTTAVTVYEVFPKGSPFSLTIIDTPGQGDTRGLDKDKLVPEILQLLFRSEDGIHDIDAVCLVLKATDARLHERQLYILDEVLSLFGKDIENTSLYSSQMLIKPFEKALDCIKVAKIPCAKTTNGQPVYFKFNNCQSDSYDEEDRENYKDLWDSGIENFQQFFAYLNGIPPKSLNMTEGVLRARKQLDANVNNLKDRIKLPEKIRLVEECYQCFEKLLETALKSTSMSSIQHLDFMIEKMKETGKQERVLKLEELKRRAQERK